MNDDQEQRSYDEQEREWQEKVKFYRRNRWAYNIDKRKQLCPDRPMWEQHAARINLEHHEGQEIRNVRISHETADERWERLQQEKSDNHVSGYEQD